MKILFEELAETQRAGGIEAACGALSARLADLGHEVLRCDNTKPRVADRWPDVVHVQGLWSLSLMRRWRDWQDLGVPCLVTVHGMLEPWALDHKKWKKRLAWAVYQKRMLRSAGLLHGTSQREVANFRRVGLQQPAALIPWGTESTIWVDAGSNRGDSSPSQRIALFVGRLYPVKGLPLLLEAWAKIRPSGWRLRLVGPDEAGNRAKLEAMVSRLNLGRTVEFVGPLMGEALAQEYRQASLFVLPSYTENFGIVVADAMSHGLPVITTHGTPWNLLESENCGWWVPVTVGGIGEAVADATQRSSDELAAMGACGREIAAERFSWGCIAGKFCDCYRWLIGERRQPNFFNMAKDFSFTSLS